MISADHQRYRLGIVISSTTMTLAYYRQRLWNVCIVLPKKSIRKFSDEFSKYVLPQDEFSKCIFHLGPVFIEPVVLSIVEAWEAEFSEHTTPPSPGDVHDLLHQLPAYVSKPSVYIDPRLKTCSHVYLRYDRYEVHFNPSYDGPYRVLFHGDRTFKIIFNGREKTVAVDRIKVVDADHPKRQTRPVSRPVSQAYCLCTGLWLNCLVQKLQQNGNREGTALIAHIQATHILSPSADSTYLVLQW